MAWSKRYIPFHNEQHPKDMGVEEVQSFLRYLATTVQGVPAKLDRIVSSTQN